MDFIKKHREIIYDVVFVMALIGILLISRAFITPITISGHSMDNTLSNGMFGYSLKVKDNTKFERGDIVIVNTDDHLIVKRIVAMPYDSIECKDNIVYLNGSPLEEEYTSSKTDDFDKVSLGENQYFILGDNRQNSKDSRIIGAISREEIIAKGLFVISLENFGVVK